MTLKDAYEFGQTQLKMAKIAEATLDAWYLLEHVTGVSRAKYFLNENATISESEETLYKEAILKRSNRIPLQHITGTQEFNTVGNDLGDVALRSILRIIGTDLNAAFHRDLAALGQIAGTELSSLSPADDGEEIRFTHTLRIGKAALHCQAESALGNSGGSGAGLRIVCQVSDQNSFVHSSTCLISKAYSASDTGFSSSTISTTGAATSAAGAAASRAA